MWQIVLLVGLYKYLTDSTIVTGVLLIVTDNRGLVWLLEMIRSELLERLIDSPEDVIQWEIFI